MLFRETETSRFLAAIRKIKEAQKTVERKTQQARDKVKEVLRKNSRSA